MFLQGEVPQLTLHFPAKFQNNHNPQFIDNGVKDWTKNPGRTANIYHRKFSAKIKDDSLQQVQSAILVEATYKEYKGFHNLIGFIWADTEPTDVFTKATQTPQRRKLTIDQRTP